MTPDDMEKTASVLEAVASLVAAQERVISELTEQHRQEKLAANQAAAATLAEMLAEVHGLPEDQAQKLAQDAHQQMPPALRDLLSQTMAKAAGAQTSTSLGGPPEGGRPTTPLQGKTSRDRMSAAAEEFDRGILELATNYGY